MSGPLSVAAVLVLAAGLAGCEKVKSLTTIFWRSGANLAADLEPGLEVEYRTRVNAIHPIAGPDGAPMKMTVDLAMKVRNRNGADETDGWMPVETEILESKFEKNGRPSPVVLTGRRVTFRYGELRRISRWEGIPLPVGVELLEIGPPKGRVKPGEEWKIETSRSLLYRETSIGLVKFFKYEGEGDLNGTKCHKLSVTIETAKAAVGAGAEIMVSGSGEVWVSKDDGRVRKATEILEGTLLDPSISL